jgi:protein-S-isoprenylcysteine O-methyltransferase Ste14
MPRRDARLVTTGPYRWVRHPMYSAALILALAASSLTANGIVTVGGVLMFGLLAARSGLEERRLIEKFGDNYRHYQRRTRRFIPWIF